MTAVAITIESVVSRSSLDAFLTFPRTVYRNDPNWVEPLLHDVERELADDATFRTYGELQPFLAFQNGQAAGRIVASINRRLNEKEGQDIGLFGYFECINDEDVAGALLEQASRWLYDRGCTLCRGPVNLSTHTGCLFQIDGFGSSPYLMMPYNPPYYPGLVEAAGWRARKDAVAYDFVMHDLSKAFERAYRRALHAGVRFRSFRLMGDGFEQDCRSLYRVFNDSFSQNWGATPRSEDEFLEEARGLRRIADAALLPVAEHDGRMIGFWMGLPDYNRALRHVGGRLTTIGILKLLWHRRSIDRARVMATGVLPQYQNLRWAVGPALVYLGMKGGLEKRRPYRRAELSWVWADNRRSRNLIEGAGGIAYKTFRLYEKTLIG